MITRRELFAADALYKIAQGVDDPQQAAREALFKCEWTVPAIVGDDDPPDLETMLDQAHYFQGLVKGINIATNGDYRAIVGTHILGLWGPDGQTIGTIDRVEAVRRDALHEWLESLIPMT